MCYPDSLCLINEMKKDSKAERGSSWLFNNYIRILMLGNSQVSIELQLVKSGERSITMVILKFRILSG